MGYQDLANSYSHELQQGTQMQAQANQQMVQGQQSLYDRFQQAYMQRQQMARQAEMDRRQQEQDRLAQEQQQWSRKRLEGNDAMALEDKQRDDAMKLMGYVSEYDARSPEMAPFIQEEAKRLKRDIKLPEVQYKDEITDPLDLSEKSPTRTIEDPLSGRGAKNRSAFEILLQKERDRVQAARLARESTESEKEKDRLARKEIQDSRSELAILLKGMAAGNTNSNNDLKRMLLQAQIDEKQGKQTAKTELADSAKAEAIASTDDVLGQLEALTTHPGLSASVGVRNPFGGALPMGLNVPGTRAANFAAELETLKAKTFLPQVKLMKGMGSLSNAEGLKLTAAVGALDSNMSETEFKKSLAGIYKKFNEAKSRMLKGAVPSNDRLPPDPERIARLKAAGATDEELRAAMGGQ